ncbi:unnamed protein product [Rotaria sp. Silwood2]|nr:unnamed protein product [Rotaria sp. Silwood2]
MNGCQKQHQEKTKTRKRRDCPPIPPPVVARRALSPRNVNSPLVGDSVNSSPFSNEKQTKNEKQHSFNVLLPIEKDNEKKQQDIRSPDKIIAKENSIVISPMQSTTPEIIMRSPSVIPKNSKASYSTYEFAMIPIECKYFFKQIRR